MQVCHYRETSFINSKDFPSTLSNLVLQNPHELGTNIEEDQSGTRLPGFSVFHQNRVRTGE